MKNRFILTKKLIDLAILFITVLVGFYLDWSIFRVIFLTLVVTHILRPFRYQDLITYSLGSYVLMMLLVLVGKVTAAETFSIVAFALLSLALVTWIIEKRRDG